MPILNYTTTINSAKTIGEIQAILARAGARSVNVGYDSQGEPEELTFLIDVGGGQFVNFRLPSRWRGVWKALQDDTAVPRKFRTEEQARRVAWRIVKDWCEAQMAIVQAGLAELSEVFLPYAVDPRTGQTLFQKFQAKQILPPEEE